MTDTIALLKELTAIPALSGREETMIAAMRRHFSGLADQVRVDGVGNVIATVHGRQASPSLLIFAHMDELGLIIRKIEPDGFLRIERVGGVPEKSLLGQWVEIHTDEGRHIPALVGTTSHHVTKPEKKFVVPDRLDLYLDVGRGSKAEVEALGIRVGDAVTYRATFTQLSDVRVAAKSLDNRVGCAMLIQTLAALAQERPAATVHLVASVQEEFNVRGVWPAFQALKPNAAICLDVTVACDTPELRYLSDVSVGGGPVISTYQFHGRGTLGGLIPNPKLRRYLEHVAAAEGILTQREVLLGVITDAAFSQLLGESGVAMASLSVATRYTHSPVESCSVRDIDAATRLLIAAARGYDAALDLSRQE